MQWQWVGCKYKQCQPPPLSPHGSVHSEYSECSISAAVKQTGTSVIVACGLAERSNGKAACPHLCLCVSEEHLSSGREGGGTDSVSMHADHVRQPLSVVNLVVVRQRWDTRTHTHKSNHAELSRRGMVRMLRQAPTAATDVYGPFV